MSSRGCPEGRRPTTHTQAQEPPEAMWLYRVPPGQGFALHPAAVSGRQARRPQVGCPLHRQPQGMPAQPGRTVRKRVSIFCRLVVLIQLDRNVQKRRWGLRGRVHVRMRPSSHQHIVSARTKQVHADQPRPAIRAGRPARPNFAGLWPLGGHGLVV